jgi:hypothetical protein
MATSHVAVRLWHKSRFLVIRQSSWFKCELGPGEKLSPISRCPPKCLCPCTRSTKSQPYSHWSLKQFRFQVDFAELRDTATQLEKCLDTLQYPHMSESNFLDELKLRVFRQNWNTFGHFEHSADDIV